jgi:nitrate/nitrite transport system substrate-binding protein
MRRWGQIGEAKDDAWYHATAREVYKPAIYRRAADALVADGVLSTADVPETDGFKPADSGFIDGVTYDGRQPNDYLRQFAIGLKD